LQKDRYRSEIDDLKESLEMEVEKSVRLQVQRDQANEGRKHLEDQLASLQQTLDQVSFTGRWTTASPQVRPVMHDVIGLLMNFPSFDNCILGAGKL